MDRTKCPPPDKFIAAVDVRSAKFLPGQPPFIRRRRSTGRFAVGVKYERQVQEHLALLVLGNPGIELKQGPWIEFLDRKGRRWCQPDAVMIDRENKYCFIYEVKYQHTSDAWWQLRCLYQPVLEKLYPGFRFGLLEICHWHDPATAFPDQYDLTSDLLRIPNGKRIAVHIWDPKRNRRS